MKGWNEYKEGSKDILNLSNLGHALASQFKNLAKRRSGYGVTRLPSAIYAHYTESKLGVSGDGVPWYETNLTSP